VKHLVEWWSPKKNYYC